MTRFEFERRMTMVRWLWQNDYRDAALKEMEDLMRDVNRMSDVPYRHRSSSVAERKEPV